MQNPFLGCFILRIIILLWHISWPACAKKEIVSSGQQESAAWKRNASAHESSSAQSDKSWIARVRIDEADEEYSHINKGGFLKSWSTGPVLTRLLLLYHKSRHEALTNCLSSSPDLGNRTQCSKINPRVMSNYSTAQMPCLPMLVTEIVTLLVRQNRCPLSAEITFVYRYLGRSIDRHREQ